MKKLLGIFVLFITITLFSGCLGNKVSANNSRIIFSFPEEYRDYLPYEEVPTYTFEFEGILNTIDNATTTNKKVFGKNDDFILSDIIAKLFNEYEEKERVTYRIISTEESYETKMNSLVEKKGELVHETKVLKVEEGKIYAEIAMINLENGLNLTFEYRRFDSIINDKLTTLYTWKYTTPLNAVLQYPLIVNQKEDGSKELLLVPLPSNVIYHLGVSENLPIETILNKDVYLNEYYRIFNYPGYSNDPREENNIDLEASKELVKNYYLNYFNGRIENEELIFTYLGKEFKVYFREVTFKIDYIGPTE